MSIVCTMRVCLRAHAPAVKTSSKTSPWEVHNYSLGRFGDFWTRVPSTYSEVLGVPTRVSLFRAMTK